MGEKSVTGSPAADVRRGVPLQPGVRLTEGKDGLWRPEPDDDDVVVAAACPLPSIGSAAR